MSDPLLLVDATFLCYRAFFSTGRLAFDGVSTGVLFGFFRDIQVLKDTFCTDQMIFCFDHGKNKRKEIYPEYKANRRHHERMGELRTQVRMLKENILCDLGVMNVLYEDGFEADDIIASLIVDKKVGDEGAVIISSDSDLYQLLSKNVQMFDPRQKKVTTSSHFKKAYSINPSEWSMVKAIAGCSSDNVKGVEGIGEKYAIKYLKGLLKGKLKNKIDNQRDLWLPNLDLVKLPFQNCPSQTILQQDPIEEMAWRRMMTKYGITTLPYKESM